MSETVAARQTPELVRFTVVSRLTDPVSAPPCPGFKRRKAVTATIGAVVEWYVMFGLLALTLSGVFFPAQASSVGLMLALATIGAGLV